MERDRLQNSISSLSGVLFASSYKDPSGACMTIPVILKLLRVFWQMRRNKPTFVSFNSLNACNEACPMCAVWRRGGDMLTVSEMAPIFRDLKAFGFKVVEI